MLCCDKIWKDCGVIYLKIKWYLPAKILGLVKDISAEYGDGAVYYRVSSKADEVFFALALSMILLMFIIGFAVRYFMYKKEMGELSHKTLCALCIALVIYSVMLSTGIGPYISFYPQGSGFIDLSIIEHIIDGLYVALLSLALWIGGRIGYRLSKRREKHDK